MFVHLQVASAYSLLSSTLSIRRLAERAKEIGFSAIALTDHNVLYGVPAFYKACLQQEIKPIIGLSADVAGEAGTHRLLLLAENNEGYRHLLKISSAIKTQQEETISEKWLSSYSGGLIAVSPGSEGEIGRYLSEGDEEAAGLAVEKYKKMFGADSFFIGLQNFKTEASVSLLEKMGRFASERMLPAAALNNVRYEKPEDQFAVKTLEAINSGDKLPDLPEDTGREAYLKTDEEMAALFSAYPEAMANTAEIAERCNVMIEMNQRLLPSFPLEPGETAAGKMQALCEERLGELGLGNLSDYRKRLRYELDVIGKMGFNDYFLIVWDFMKYARENGILTGPGRGSAAGSLVAYLLRITAVDPLRYGLLFERFLNPERVTMPDIDIDFPDHRRDEVIGYVVQKYGRLHVAQIITFGTFAAKAALRDTARAFGLPPLEIDNLSKRVPSKLGISLKQAYSESEGLRSFAEASGINRRLFATAQMIEGLPRHTSTHAAGVVISTKPLPDLIPIQGGHGETYLTQFPMEDLEEIGLLKMDFLGLRNLSLLERVIKSIEFGTGRKITIAELPFDDEKTLNLLQKGETTGIFQFESAGMRKVLRELRPTEFEDLVAVNALFRPGPMDHIPIYIARKHGKEKIEYPHPDLQPILEITYGVIVYQEQIMQIASLMAGFSLGEADLLRRAVSKKKRDVLDRERERFVRGARNKGYSDQAANETYDLIVKFANYGFNRSHAVAYSLISWQLSWLKAHYPVHFMAALLTSAIGNDEKVAAYIAECRQMGINIAPPSINKSRYPFSAEDGDIRFSLAAIKGMGMNSLRGVIEAREKGPFKDLFDFCLRVPQRAVNRKLLERLVHSGAFDEFGKDRAVLLATLDVAMEHAELMRPEDGMHDLFMEDEAFAIKPKYADAEPISTADKLAFEKESLGVYLSDHPAGAYASAFTEAGAKPLIDLHAGQRNVKAGVYVSRIKTIRTKKGDVMAFVTLSDASGEMEAVVFPDLYRQSGPVLKEGAIVLAEGSIEERNRQPQMIIKRLIPASSLSDTKKESGGKVLYLKISAELENNESLSEVKAILLAEPGATPVILYYEEKKRTIRLDQGYSVKPTEKCLQKLRALLGERSVMLK